MTDILFCLIVQVNMIFGVAGLLWPDKLMPFHAVLMFPWRATHRAIRLHGVIAVAGWILVLAKVLILPV